MYPSKVMAATAKKIEKVKVRSYTRTRVGHVEESGQEAAADGRARRAKALQLIAGIWKDRTDIPTDGLEYERMMRSEW